MEKLNLPLPEGFLQEEVRCEYTVSEQLKKIWAVQLDLLTELLRVCEKYDLKVFAAYGTLLGAIRHKGFIPWDDDMDLYMLRTDYDKLIEIGAAEFKEPYFLQTPLSDRDFFTAPVRLRNSNTTAKISFYDSPTFHSGIFIDIVVLEGYCSDDKKRLKQIKDRTWVEHFIHCYHADIRKQRLSKKIVYSFVQPLLRKLVSYEWLIDKYHDVVTRYEDSEYVTCLYAAENEGDKWVYFPRSYFEKPIMKEFEFIQIPVPEQYEWILRNIYGDYNVFPPVEKRGIWHDGVIQFDPDTPWKEFIQKHQ